ncbi:unnamed protein product [Paramecium pentaurelia]|uniref:PI31 proteasome regulator C-terminal domain-containing protein n=1 Tax=Paramecium pentaurelia TaxID=43138 RepID=A0A8S1WZK6_9CILI|nr:unnamed protein product [Paramecium pentaurelia]
MTTLREIYNEILFLLPDQPTNKTLLTILLIHSINVKEGLKNNGINENDESHEWVGIAEGWDQPEDGVYSLRYINQYKEQCQFKFLTLPQQDDTLSINAVILGRNDQIYSYKLPISSLNFDNQDLLFKSNTISVYKQQILQKIVMKKQEPQQIEKQTNILLEQPPQQQQPQGLLWNIPRNQPFSVGNQDINPFPRNPFDNRGQISGNLMGPQHFQNFNQRQQQQQLFNPQIPPGARFDPFGPEPDINPFGEPSNKKPWIDPFGRGGQFPF